MKYLNPLLYLVVTTQFLVAQEHDYFDRARFPGERRPDVSLDVVKQEAGQGYTRRTVQWWPKQGVDFVAVPPGVELRTWTINPELVELSSNRDDSVWWPVALRGKTQFKAHLLGFRGIGLGIGNPYNEDSDYFCPAVVLRLEDGRKRCFVRGSFSENDERYIVELYEREMARIRALNEPRDLTVNPRDLTEWGSDPLYSEGSTMIESDHFVAALGTEPPGDKAGSLWLIEGDEETAARNRELIIRGWEDWWTYNEYAGHLMPYQERLENYKYKIRIGGTKKNGVEILNRGNGGSYGGMSTANGNWWGVFHEWTHGALCGDMLSLGGAETICDAAQLVGDPNTVKKVHLQLQRPWKNLFWGQYPGGLGWTMLGDDPNWGYAAPATIAPLMSAEEMTPMHAIARLGERRGIFEDGIRGMGDLLGQIGARMAELDTELEAGFRKAFVSADRTALRVIDAEERRYRSPLFESPEPFGVNLVRLLPDEGAREISVDFQGDYDPETFSDWRCCLVAVDTQGRCRYSPLWNKGRMSLEVKPGDRRFWLTVVATPTGLMGTGDNAGRSAWALYQGGFAWRYPYEVQLFGARPGSPHTTVADNDNLSLTGWDQGKLTSLGEFPPIGNEEARRALAKIDHNRAAALLANCEGAPHPNGGGWVAKTATVEPTAYVAIDAMVLDQAQVLGNAVIADYAVVKDQAVVRDKARVFNKTVLTGNTEISGEARVYQSFDRNTDDVKLRTPQRRLKFPNSTLLAAYEMDAPETVLLEDHCQERTTGNFYFGAHRNPILVFSGVLKGEPGFVADGDRKALVFNGESQFAELPGEILDLETFTIDLCVNWAGGTRPQTLLAVGDWKVTVSETGQLSVDGVRTGAIGQGKWRNVRISFGGGVGSVWLDGSKAPAGFDRPPRLTPGEPRLATLGANSGGDSPFHGSIDYLRIYAAVPGEGELDVPLLSSRKVQDDFKERFDARFAGYDRLETEIEATLKDQELFQFYKAWNERVDATIAELQRSPEVQEMERELAELRKREQNATGLARTELMKDPEFRKLEEDYKASQLAFDKAQERIMAEDPEFASQQQAWEDALQAQRELERQAEDTARKSQLRYGLLEKQLAGVSRQIEELSARLEAGDPYTQKMHADLEKLRSVTGPERDEAKIRNANAAYKASRNSLRQNSPEFAPLIQQQRNLNEEKLAIRRELATKNPAYREAKITAQAAQNWMIDRRIAVKKHPELIKLQNARRALSPDASIDRMMRETGGDLLKRIQRLEGNIEKLKVETARQKHPEFYKALEGLAFGRRQYKKLVLKGLKEQRLPDIAEDIEQAMTAHRFQSVKWHTKVDWEGRAPYEFDDKAMAQPIMQRWLKRMKPWRYGTDEN